MLFFFLFLNNFFGFRQCDFEAAELLDYWKHMEQGCIFCILTPLLIIFKASNESKATSTLALSIHLSAYCC